MHSRDDLETVTTLRLTKDCVFKDMNGEIQASHETGKVCSTISGLIAGHYYQTSIGAIYADECEVIGTRRMTYNDWFNKTFRMKKEHNHE